VVKPARVKLPTTINRQPTTINHQPNPKVGYFHTKMFHDYKPINHQLMKKLLLSLLLINCLSGNAQDYVPFLDNTAWCEEISYFGGSNDVWIMPAGNETVNGQEYVKYSNVPFLGLGDVLMREDVAGRKVYRLYNNNEVLLYDFSLQVDDLITMNNGAVLKVTHRDSVPSVTGRKRVSIRVAQEGVPTGFGINESWIEGVGNWAHPLMHEYEMLSDPAGSIKCSFTNTLPSYNSGLVNGGTADICALPTASVAEHLARPQFVMTHDFAAKQLNVNTTSYFNNATITLTNTLGQTIKQQSGFTGYEITLPYDTIATGVYLVNISQNGQVLYSGKTIL
jgi:hypothetical protein